MKDFLYVFFLNLLFSIFRQSGKKVVKNLEKKENLKVEEAGEDDDNTIVEGADKLKEETEKDNPHPSPVSGPLDSRHGPSCYLARARNKHILSQLSHFCVFQLGNSAWMVFL